MKERSKGTIGRDEYIIKITEFVSNFEDQYYENGIEKKPYLFDLYGIGGIGKSTLLKSIADYDQYANKNINSIYVDTSAYEREVYILLAIRNIIAVIYENNDSSVDLDFLKFDLMYEFFYRTKEYKLHNKSGVAGQIVNMVWGTIVDSCEEDIINNRMPTYENLSGMPMDIIVKAVKALPSIAGGVLKYHKNKNERKKLEEIAKEIEENCKSEYERQIYVRSVFIKCIKTLFETFPFVVIIDNFRLHSGQEGFERDHRWLTSELGLFKNLPACWIIGGRESSSGLFKDIKEEQKKMMLEGVEYPYIEAYYKMLCKDVDKDIKVLNKMLEGAVIKANSKKKSDIEKDIVNLKESKYLPIKMKLIAERYNDIKKQRDVTVDDLGRINQLDDLSYFFEMSLSDAKIDAFYILSCLNSWDRQWIDVVKRKFDLYLLNANYVLNSFSSVERIDEVKFKLHDAVRESLYKSPNNIIKYDVLHWFYQLFLHLQNEEEIHDPTKDDEIKGINDNPRYEERSDDSIIYDLDSLGVFVYASLEYLRYEGEKDKRRDGFLRFYQAFNKTYDNYKESEKITDQIVNILGYVYEKSVELFIDDQNSLDIISRVLRDQGYLLTNYSKNDEALSADLKALNYAKKVVAALPAEGRTWDNYISPNIELYSCENSVGWDYGHLWNYDKAIEHGYEAMKGSLELMRDSIEYMQMEEQEREAYVYFIQYLNKDINQDYQEYIDNPNEKLKESIQIMVNAVSWKGFKDIFFVFIKSCGNLPWYYFRSDSGLDIRKKNFGNFKPVAFGARTFYLRKLIYGVDQLTFISWHNVSVYLSREKEYDKALANEFKVLEAAEQILKSNEYSEAEVESKQKELIDSGMFKVDVFKVICSEYKGDLSKKGLISEILQYISSFYFDMYKKQNKPDKNDELLKSAMTYGLRAFVYRYCLYLPGHEKTLESLKYISEYYYACGEKEKAVAQMRYVMEHIKLNNNYGNYEKISEYDKMYNKMIKDEWDLKDEIDS